MLLPGIDAGPVINPAGLPLPGGKRLLFLNQTHVPPCTDAVQACHKVTKAAPCPGEGILYGGDHRGGVRQGNFHTTELRLAA